MKQKIDHWIGQLSELSVFLVRIKHHLSELEVPEQTDAVKKFLDGFFIPKERRCADDVVLQLNEVGSEKTDIDEIFNEKEISKMPKLKEFSYRFITRTRIHEFRYRRNGICKYFCSTDFKTAKQRALEFCRELNRQESEFFDKNVYFNTFANDYMLNVKKRNVAEKSFANDYNRFNNYIIPAFKGKRLRDVKAPFLQKFLNDVLDAGYQRTAEALYYILKTVLDYAVNNDYILKNPICAVKIPLHVRENGKALPLALEKKFVNDVAGTKYELNFMVLLYTGCRPCELETLSFEKDGFLTFQNRKQKHGAVVFKDIPITPMLDPYVDRIRSALPLPKTTEFAKIFSKMVPGYRLYDLRHTFATRCQTCGVPQEVVGRWLGHKSQRITDDVYTHLPPNFMLEQAKKVVY